MPTRDQWALIVAGMFLLANIVVPVVVGDLYPFTSGPMFRDAPQLYCNYRVYDPDGKLLDAKSFLTFRVYDGNPVGYGVGIKPPKVIEEFGTVRDKAYCEEHMRRNFEAADNRDYPFVTIEQDVIGPTNGQHVALLRTDHWRVDNPRYRTKD